jgi:hypothetical protein
MPIGRWLLWKGHLPQSLEIDPFASSEVDKLSAIRDEMIDVEASDPPLHFGEAGCVHACQVAASASRKPTRRPIRRNPEADPPISEQPKLWALFSESPERPCLGSSCMSNPVWSLHATMQVPHDIAASVQALSPLRHSNAETDGIALNHPVDRLH